MMAFIANRRRAGVRRHWCLRFGLTAALLAAGGLTAEAATLTLACLPVGQAVEHCRAAAESWSEESGHEVRVVTAAGEGREALEAYESLLSIQSPRLDVIAFPAKWGPTLAPHLIDLATAPPSGIAPGTLDAAAALGRFGVKQIGAPHHLSLGVLFYRRDLVPEPPSTWRELGAVVDRVNAARPDQRLDGLIFPSIPVGDLVFTMLEWIASHGAAPIVGDGTRPVAQPESVRAALAVIDGWVGSIIPPETARLDRTATYAAFRDGRAVFMRHWSYLYPELVDNLGQTTDETGPPPILAGMSALPRADVEGGVSRGALLVWLIGVSRYSNNQEAAKQLVAHLTSEPVQRAAAIDHGLAPTITSLYSDEAVLAAQGWLAIVGARLETAILPPVAAFGANYLEAIDSIGAVARDMITSGLSAEDATRTVDRVIARIRRGGTN